MSVRNGLRDDRTPQQKMEQELNLMLWAIQHPNFVAENVEQQANYDHAKDLLKKYKEETIRHQDEKTFGTPIGLFWREADIDRYENLVSLIHLADGSHFRMVHHIKGWRPRRHSTIYFGRGKHVKVKEYSSDNDTVPNSVSVTGNGFTCEVSWGDGDNLGVFLEGEYTGPVWDPVKETLAKIREDDFNLALVVLCDFFKDKPGVWLMKEPMPTHQKPDFTAKNGAYLKHYYRHMDRE